MADTEGGDYNLVETEPSVAVSGRWFKAASVLLLGTAGLVFAFSAVEPSNSARLHPSAIVDLDSRGPAMVHYKELVNMQLPVTPGQVNGAYLKCPGTDLSVGLYRLLGGNSNGYTYRYPEFKYIVEGEWHLTDGTGQVVHAKAGDLIYFPMGTSVEFTVVKTGLGYYIAEIVPETTGFNAEALKAAAALNPKMVHFPQIAEKTNLTLIENLAGSPRFFKKDIAFDSGKEIDFDPNMPGLEMTAGLVRLDAGPAWTTTYDHETFALVTEGEFHLEDGTGQHITAKAGDMVYFPKGTQLSSKANHFGLALFSDLRSHKRTKARDPYYVAEPPHSANLLPSASVELASRDVEPSNSAHLLPTASMELGSRGLPMVHYKQLVNTHLPVTAGQVNGAFLKCPGTDMSVGLYRLLGGTSNSHIYQYPEFKYIVEGEWHVTDGTGQVVHAKAGDLIYFPMGTSVEFTVVKTGLGYYIAGIVPETQGVNAEVVKAAAALNPRIVHFPQIAEKTNLTLIENRKDIVFDSTVPGLEMTAGLMRLDAGPALTTTYDHEEFVLVTEGEFHLEDGTGQHITAKAGDMVYISKGTQLSSKANHFGLALFSDLRYPQ